MVWENSLLSLLKFLLDALIVVLQKIHKVHLRQNLVTFINGFQHTY